MGLFSLFKNNRPAPPNERAYITTFVLSYIICYRGLPRRLFANPAGVIASLQNGGKDALRTYLEESLGDCWSEQLLIIEVLCGERMPPDLLSWFSMEVCQADSDRSLILISYPFPEKMPELKPNLPQLAKVALVAPYFAAIVFNPLNLSDGVEYFVLSLNPTGTTTLRCVDADGGNGNCGPGCVPTLANFVSLLSRRFAIGAQRAQVS